MTNTVACVVVIIATLVAITVWLAIWKLGQYRGSSTTDKFLKSVDAIRSTKSVTDKLFVLPLAILFLLRGTMGLFVNLAIGALSVAAFSGVCAPDSTLGRIVWDIYERYIRPWLDSRTATA